MSSLSSSSLPCYLKAQVAFKAGGHVFHHLCTSNPLHFANITPGKVQKCELIQGSFDTNGSVIQWIFTLDGKEQTAKHVLENIDKVKKTATYRYIGGELLQVYKTLVVTFHVETSKDDGGGVDYITWTLDYELAKPDNPHPLSFLQFLIEFTQETEKHIFG